MCDFREYPYAVQDIETGQIIETPDKLRANITDYDLNHQGIPFVKDVTVSGMYFICATGAFYSYFDGSKWWYDRDDWGPPSKEHWQDTGGIPPQHLKYKFLRHNNEQVHCH